MKKSLHPSFQRAIDLVEEFRGKGRFTHAYLGCGGLDQAELFFEHEVASHPKDHRGVYDLASLTKALATTPLVFRDLEKTGQSLDQEVSGWLGEELGGLLHSRLQRVTLRDLLSHTSGLPAWANFWLGRLGVENASSWTPKAIVEKLSLVVEQRGLQPRGTHLYSDLGFILLGLGLKKRGGRSLEGLFKDHQARLGAAGLGFSSCLPSKEAQSCVPTSFCPVRKRRIVAEVHDENCAAFGGAAGHAGLFGAGPAVFSYLRALLSSPVGQALLQENLKALGGRSMPGLCGWAQGEGPKELGFGARGSLGHLGFTGTAFWFCPQQKSVGICLTNRVVSGRRSPWIGAFRKKIFELMYEALEESI